MRSLRKRPEPNAAVEPEAEVSETTMELPVSITPEQHVALVKFGFHWGVTVWRQPVKGYHAVQCPEGWTRRGDYVYDSKSRLRAKIDSKTRPAFPTLTVLPRFYIRQNRKTKEWLVFDRISKEPRQHDIVYVARTEEGAYDWLGLTWRNWESIYPHWDDLVPLSARAQRYVTFLRKTTKAA